MLRLNERIKMLRTENHISQSQLAKALVVSQKAVSLWESGDRVPSATAIASLAKYFCVSADYLLGLDE